ncbi:hypothetical protein SLEP1_g36278 [Rubroshorea leprosula]|uniref:Uncharacterized protein n=1 Tax=Rubroshorea leprosula TaxID=152421 RepID=A0AAV5KRH7_9ROSI|nr:hypothetical protein SLEP1_g36278 [Rubroshorea leprosula]
MRGTKDGEEVPNPNRDVWLNNDGLLTNWLLGRMNEEALNLVLKEQLATKRGDNESLEDFIRKFKGTCDRLAAINKPLDDLDRVLQLSRVVGIRYQPYNLAVLSKAPYPTFNQYIVGLPNNQKDMQTTRQESKDKTPIYAQVFVAQRRRGNRGRGYGTRNFNSRGKGHIALKCWHRFDHAYQSEGLPQALATLTMMKDRDQNVYIDTGATDHMIADPVNKFPGGIFLSQAKYAKDILCRASMLEAFAIATPMAIKDTITLRDNELVNDQEYRKLVGALQ